MDIARIRKKLREARKRAGEREQSAPDDSEAKGDEGHRSAVRAKDIESPPPEGLSPEEGHAVAEPEEAGLPAPGGDDVRQQAEEYLKFGVGKEMFALRVSEIEEILRPQRITMVPRTAPYVLGVTSYRGKMIPVLDISRRLAVSENGARGNGASKIVVLRGAKDLLGIPIRAGMDVIALSGEVMLDPPSHLSEEESRFIKGVVVLDGGFVSVVRTEELTDFNVSGEA